MAQKVLVNMIDDLDGTEAHQTVQFGLDGKSYAIDVSDRNERRLRKIFTKYLPHARKLGCAGRGRPSTRTTGRQPRDTARRIRDWAAQNGHELAGRGRIPVDVIEAYERRDRTPKPPAATGGARNGRRAGSTASQPQNGSKAVRRKTPAKKR